MDIYDIKSSKKGICQSIITNVGPYQIIPSTDDIPVRTEITLIIQYAS